MPKKMDTSWVNDRYNELLSSTSTTSEDETISPVVASLTLLTEFLRETKAETLMGLQQELSQIIAVLKNISQTLAVGSATELFSRFVSRSLSAADVRQDVAVVKAVLAERGEKFVAASRSAKARIAQSVSSFVREGSVLLTLAYSRVVVASLLAAARAGVRFSVIVLVSSPDNGGVRTAAALATERVPVTLVPDSAAAHFLERADMVLIGAEAIVENGGVLNKVGTFGLALAAAALRKPLYVAGESFKFTREYPLGQTDFKQKTGPPPPSLSLSPSLSPSLSSSLSDPLSCPPPGVSVSIPVADYTPPLYISLLITELGILTPSAVSDELIKLYG
jgi:translation initiation factor eIF-2B subunit alpha